MEAATPTNMKRTLPKYVIVQSNFNNRYLHINTENPEVPNALRFDGDYSFDLDTRFEVVPATTGSGLVHIRSLQNNKYWANFGTGNNWVAAMAAKPQENQSDQHCTLFQPVYLSSDNNHVLGLRHVSTGYYVKFFVANANSYGLLFLSTVQNKDYDVCTILDWESIVVLPDLIRIKADNGCHLKAFDDGFMDFNNQADNSSYFDYEVSPSRNGGIRLKSTHFGNYWTDMDDSYWVLLQQASPTLHDTNTVFLPTKMGGNRIIIRSLRNDLFCKRYSSDGSRYGTKHSCLATIANYPDEYGNVEIEEPVISRKIDNIRYHLTDARLYNEKSVALISDDSSNKTKNPLTSELNLKTTVSNTTNWSTSTSFNVGVKMNLTFGVPFIESGNLEISGDVTKSSEWGKTETEILEVGTVKTITVAPMTRLKASLMATRLSYDIPFSYMQYDVLKNGKTKVSEKNDGIFTGHNGYGYRYEVVPLPLE